MPFPDSIRQFEEHRLAALVGRHPQIAFHLLDEELRLTTHYRVIP